MEVKCFESKDLEVQLEKILHFVSKLESQIIEVTSFNGESVTGQFKFFQDGYNEKYIDPSFGELFLIDDQNFDHFFFFHEIQRIEILKDPLLKAMLEEQETGGERNRETPNINPLK